MADRKFEDPRLVATYDAFEEPRPDLDVYAALAAEFGARRVVDVGCGTGSLAVLLAAHGFDVVGVDPAAASLAVARAKPHADRVRWIHGTAVDLPDLDADLVLMTGNVAQAVTGDDDWRSTLAAVARVLRPGGRLVFETRDPARRAWEQWYTAAPVSVDVPDVGVVTQRGGVTEVDLPLVSFRETFEFDDGTVSESTSTLRFREHAEIAAALDDAGLPVDQVRDAPDRPGLEWVFVARRPGQSAGSTSPARPGTTTPDS